VHKGVGQGWRREGITVPCRCAWRVGLGEVLVHRNAGCGLGALGGQTASRWHGWAAVHGRSHGFLLQGIGPLGRDGASGEVMGQRVVGAALPTLGAHGGHGDVQGGVGCSCSVSARWGRF
jgi:hypothetical protein